MLSMARDRYGGYDARPNLRSRSRERSPLGVRRTDRDDGIGLGTSDPETVNARIFVGSLTPEITRKLLQDHFSRWGDVVGVTITKNKFGFVQFRTDMEAKACLASGYSTIINGARLDIKQAKLGSGQNAPPLAPGLGSHREVEAAGPSRGGGWGGGPPSKFADREYDSVREPPRDSYFDSYYRDSQKGRSDERLGRYEDSYRSRDYYGSNRDPYYRDTESSYSRSSYDAHTTEPSEPLDPLDPTRPNDIEIVVPHKMQRAFAESIEARLRQFDLLVDLLFPPPDITPERVISDLTARRCLYVIFATAENEKHHSLTLTILHGEPQEHRNMPVDQAMRLIQEDFEEYVKKARMRNMREVVPRDIRILLLDMLEMRPLSMGDLDKLIKYLRERQNALVDDQIEQKRETAGHQTQSSVVTRSMAVTYPGYNYLTSNVPAAAASPTTHPATVGGVLSTGSHTAAVAGAVNIVSATSMSAAYPATSFSSLQSLQAPNLTGTTSGVPATAMSAASLIGPYGVTHLGPAAPTQTQFGSMAGAPADKHPEMHLQERILSLMKGSSTINPSGTMQAPTGVPAPSAVPAPAAVPSQRMIQHAQEWLQNPHSARSADSSKMSHGNQAPYNPWSQ